MKKPGNLSHRSAVNPHLVMGGYNSKDVVSPQNRQKKELSPKFWRCNQPLSPFKLSETECSYRLWQPHDGRTSFTAKRDRRTLGIFCAPAQATPLSVCLTAFDQNPGSRTHAVCGRSSKLNHFFVYPHLSSCQSAPSILVSRNSEYNRQRAAYSAKSHKCGLGLPVVHLDLDGSCLFSSWRG